MPRRMRWWRWSGWPATSLRRTESPTRATGWAPTPAPPPTREASTLTCTCSAAGRWGGHRARIDTTMATGQNDTTTTRIVVPGAHSMVALLGSSDELLRLVERAFTCDIHVRGNEITITGERTEVDL